MHKRIGTVSGVLNQLEILNRAIHARVRGVLSSFTLDTSQQSSKESGQATDEAITTEQWNSFQVAYGS